MNIHEINQIVAEAVKYILKIKGPRRPILENEFVKHKADTSTHGVSEVDGVTERNAAIADHAADTSTHGVNEVAGTEDIPAFATPAIVLGATAGAGSATTVIKSDSTIAAFDATNPTTQAFGDSPVVGTAAYAARRDHKHGMPAIPASSGSYDGDQTTNRAIPHSLGRIPKIVLITCAADIWFRITNGLAAVCYATAITLGSQSVTAPDATNFYVGDATNYYQSANANGLTYYWVAIG